MKTMEKVSIILPIYNVEEYISECLDSIVNQTYRNLEIILVDDGSLDNSGKICDEYQQKDDRIVVVHKQNAGVSVARNTGLELATGAYIAFADPDDWLEPDMIEKMVSALEQRQADIAFCRFHTEIMPEEKQMMYQAIKEEEGNGIDAVWHMFNSAAYGTMVWNKLFKRKTIFRKNGFVQFDSTLKCGEDEVWLVEVLLGSDKIAYLKDELYYWRIRDNSAYRKKLVTDIQLSDLEAHKKALSLVGEENTKLCNCIIYRLNYNIYKYMIMAYVNGQADYLKKLKEYRRTYIKFWYASVPIKKIVKRFCVELCMNLHISRKMVAKLYGL